jgi:uroporphyrinogen-III decarboxylase
MNSHDRMIGAIRSQPVDHVPCCPTWWQGPPPEQSFDRDGEERLSFALDELGIDAHLGFSPPQPPIVIASRIERVPGERYPLLHSAVDTPKGPMTATVRKTEDYPHDSVPLFSDFASARYVKPWIETMDDVARFESIFRLPSDDEVAATRKRFQDMRALADRRQVLMIGYAGVTLDTAVWMMGAERAVLASVDRPEVVDRLVEAVAKVDRFWLDAELSWGVEAVFRRGWYDTTDFWSPSDFARWVVPRLAADTRAAHLAGAAMIYQACTGLGALLPHLGRIGFDCLLEAEPVLGGIAPEKLRQALPGKSFWGGISAPMHIGEGTPRTVREAVRSAFAGFGPKGFILKAVPSIRRHWPWENVLAMIDEWKKLSV